MKYKDDFEKNGKNKGIKALAFGSAVGFVAVMLLTCIVAAIMTASEISTSKATVAATVILAVSSLVCGFATGKFAKERLLIFGAASGALMYLVIAVAAVAITKNSLSSLFALRAAVCSVVSALASALTALKKVKLKY